MAAPIWSTEAEFDAATLSNVRSNLGLLRFANAGLDFGGASGYTVQNGSGIRTNTALYSTTDATENRITINGTSAFTDGTVRIRTRLSTTNATSYIMTRYSGANDFQIGGPEVNNSRLAVYKKVAGAYTTLASVAFAYGVGNVIDARVVTSGTSITVYDDTNSISTSAGTDSDNVSGSIGWVNGPTGSGTNIEAIRQDSTALTGSASLPTSTTYVDLGSAVALSAAMWDETLGGGNVTVDVYGSDNGTSDAAGASATGLTDPNGSAFSAGSHRYWRVVVNFTRDNTTQEPTIGRIALAATDTRGAHQSGFAGSGMRAA